MQDFQKAKPVIFTRQANNAADRPNRLIADGTN